MAAVLPTPLLIDTQVTHDAVEPGREPRFVLELRGALHDSQKRLLRDLLGQAAVTQLSQHEVVDPPPMAPDQLGKGLPISALVADHEHFVRCIALHGRHRVFDLPGSEVSWGERRPFCRT